MGVGMVDLNPEIWDNPTLGEAATNGFADEKELQAIEDAAAKREGREPWIAKRLHRYPGSQNDVSIESSYDDGMRLVDPSTLLESSTEVVGVEFSETEPQFEGENPEMVEETEAVEDDN
jgi:hypothetical protein